MAERIEVLFDVIRDGISAFEDIARQAEGLKKQLHAAPDPLQACGDGTCAMSKQFPGDYDKMGGNDVVDLLDGLPGTCRQLSDGLAEGLIQLETSSRDAAEMAEQAKRGTGE